MEEGELLGAVSGGLVVVAQRRPQRPPGGQQGPVGRLEVGLEEPGLAEVVDVVAGGDEGVDPVAVPHPLQHVAGHGALGRPAAEVAEGHEARHGVDTVEGRLAGGSRDGVHRSGGRGGQVRHGRL